MLDVEFTRFGDAHTIISSAIDAGRDIEVSIISKVDAEELARKYDHCFCAGALKPMCAGRRRRPQRRRQQVAAR